MFHEFVTVIYIEFMIFVMSHICTCNAFVKFLYTECVIVVIRHICNESHVS